MFTSYAVLLYQQPSTFTAPAAYSQPDMGVSTFDFPAYVKVSHLSYHPFHRLNVLV